MNEQQLFNRRWKEKRWEFGQKKGAKLGNLFYNKKGASLGKKGARLDKKKVRDWAINLSIKKGARLGKKGANLGNLFFNKKSASLGKGSSLDQGGIITGNL